MKRKDREFKEKRDGL